MLHDQRLFNLIRGPNLVLKPKNDEKTDKVVSHLVCITEGKNTIIQKQSIIASIEPIQDHDFQHKPNFMVPR